MLPADATEAQFFGVPAGSELICIERVRTADGIPVMLENNTYVYEDNAFLAKADLTCLLYTSLLGSVCAAA